MLDPEGNISRILAVVRSLHQAALLHKFLHEIVNFMIDLPGSNMESFQVDQRLTLAYCR